MANSAHVMVSSLNLKGKDSFSCPQTRTLDTTSTGCTGPQLELASLPFPLVQSTGFGCVPASISQSVLPRRLGAQDVDSLSELFS